MGGSGTGTGTGLERRGRFPLRRGLTAEGRARRRCVRALAQIMSPLLAHLGVDDLDADSIDWGTLVVYTCPANCARPAGAPSAYRRELVWRQHFSGPPAHAS